VGNTLWVADINGDFIYGKRELPDGFIVTLVPETLLTMGERCHCEYDEAISDLLFDYRRRTTVVLLLQLVYFY